MAKKTPPTFVTLRALRKWESDNPGSLTQAEHDKIVKAILAKPPAAEEKAETPKTPKTKPAAEKKAEQVLEKAES